MVEQSLGVGDHVPAGAVTAPAGAIVKLYVDLKACVDVGDIIETQSGRRYSVVAKRVQARGKHVGRQHLSCSVMAPDDPLPTTGMLHRIVWYRRAAKRRR